MTKNKILFGLNSEFNILHYLKSRSPKNIHTFSKEIGITYSHIHKTLRLMQKQGYITITKTKENKRDMNIKLTIKGRVLANKIIDIKKYIKHH